MRLSMCVCEHSDRGFCSLNLIVYLFSLDPFLSQLCEMIVVCGAFYKGSLELREMASSGWGYFGGKGSAFLENIMALSFCSCIGSALFFRVLGSEAEDIPVAIGSLVAWMYLLFFLLGFRLTGPFIGTEVN